MSFKRREKKYLLTGRHQPFGSGFIFFVVFLFLAATALLSWQFIFKKTFSRTPRIQDVYSAWEHHDFELAYDKAGQILTARPLDGEALSMRGFSAYYLYVEQTDSNIAQQLLAESIQNLRNAWHRVVESERPFIAYVLGKAYYQRGLYFADLASFYLEYAHNSGVAADDLDEFRALSFSSLGNHEASINAFLEALSAKPSDLLVYSLAQSYVEMKDSEKAEQYFLETIRITNDELLQLKSRNALGLLYLNALRIDDAHREFALILEKEPNSADAHYGLGVVYEIQGDLIRARAEWRKALKADPLHGGARLKMNS